SFVKQLKIPLLIPKPVTYVIHANTFLKKATQSGIIINSNNLLSDLAFDIFPYNRSSRRFLLNCIVHTFAKTIRRALLPVEIFEPKNHRLTSRVDEVKAQQIVLSVVKSTDCSTPPEANTADVEANSDQPSPDVSDAIENYLQNPDPNSTSSAFDELAAEFSTGTARPKNCESPVVPKVNKLFGNNSSKVSERPTLTCSAMQKCQKLFTSAMRREDDITFSVFFRRQNPVETNHSSPGNTDEQQAIDSEIAEFLSKDIIKLSRNW
ncbi:Hypothetical predicted protein, partial [Paramuricea clavata]